MIQRGLRGESVECGGDEEGDFGVFAAQGRDVAAGVGQGREEDQESCKFDSMADQREARGSSDGAAEREPGEAGGCEAEPAGVSVGVAWSLVSGGVGG